ncbi:hypothetical protein PMI21_04536 [Pseudomonas sp. GM18]|nr:hypothetical protein PMI21_04536 [Pseudomonas sp. GM18]
MRRSDLPAKNDNARCSSCRACEAAFGGEAVVKSDIAVCQENLAYRVCDGFARMRPTPNAASQARQLLQIALRLN